MVVSKYISNKKVIAVSGTHGKTTVTSMIAHSLVDNNFDPNYLIAGIPKKLDKSWNISKMKYLLLKQMNTTLAFLINVQNSFIILNLILLINNIEFDHADIYENIEMIEENFFELIKTMP